MANNINYINSTTGDTSDIAVEKVEQFILDTNAAMDVFLEYDMIPNKTEAINSGGSIIKYLIGQGEDVAKERDAAPTETNRTVDGGINVEPFTLTVDKPVEYPHDGKIMPFDPRTTKEMDGIAFDAQRIGGLTKALFRYSVAKKKQLIEDATPLVDGVVKGKARKFTLSSTDALGGLKELNNIVVDYADFSIDNDNWKLTTPVGNDEWREDYPALRFYHQGEYDLDLDAAVIEMNPRDIVKFSTVNTEAGAGSVPQFAQFEQGTLNFIAGFKVKSNRKVKKGFAWILVKGKTFATVPAGMDETNIFAGQFHFAKEQGARGERYYDAALPTPEIITVVDLTSVVTTLKEQQKKNVDMTNTDGVRGAGEATDTIAEINDSVNKEAIAAIEEQMKAKQSSLNSIQDKSEKAIVIAEIQELAKEKNKLSK